MRTTKKVVRSNSKRLSLSTSAYQRYDQDFFKWTKTQANLLKKGKLEELDVDHLIEEIESLGRSDKRSLKSHLIILLIHLLKKKYQSKGEGNSHSWSASIRNAEIEIKLILEDSPSLKKELSTLYENAYDYAREKAAFETKLSIGTFPKKCPWEIQEILPFLRKRTPI